MTGIVCPSCGLSVDGVAASSHGLKFSEGDLAATVAAGGTVQCPGGKPAALREHLADQAVCRYMLIQEAIELLEPEPEG